MSSPFSLSESPRHIVVRMPNWLGDLVMATPILEALRRQWPKAHITAMCQGHLGSVIQEDPHVDAILSFQRPKGFLRWFERENIVSPLQKGDYDLGILLTNSLSSAWWFWRGKVRWKVGFSTHGRRWLLDLPVPWPKERHHQHLVKTYKMLLEPLGIPPSKIAPRLYLTPTEEQAANDRLAQAGVHPSDMLVGINPGAAYGSAKCWLPERFVELSRQLLATYPRLKIVFFGDKAGSPLVDRICADLPPGVLNFAGKTSLRELIALIRRCRLFLTNDSGPMHVASALGTPLVALFGSTSDTATGPYRDGAIVIHKHVSCSPCYLRKCPIDFRCMTQIEVAEVYEKMTSLLSCRFLDEHAHGN